MPGTMPVNVGQPLTAIREVADDFEKLNPTVRIEFENVPTGVREWLVTQLTAEQAPDIVAVNVEDVWPDVHKGWYLPLDQYLQAPIPGVPEGKPGSEKWWDVFKYQAISRGKAGPDGKMYCISYDMIETAIFYNKDIFQEVGVRPPKNWAEFNDLQEELRRAGYIPVLTAGWHILNWGLDLVFDQLYQGILPGIDLIQDPLREPYLRGYLDGEELCFLHDKGFFTSRDPRWRECWRILKKWRRHANKDIMSADMMRLFMIQKGAMYWGTTLDARKLADDPDVGFEWDLFYLPPIPPRVSEYSTAPEMCVIGGSGMQFEVTNTACGDTGDPATSERLPVVISFLRFLTLPENVDRVVNEAGLLLPNAVGVDPAPVLQPFDDILKRRYTTTKWTTTFNLKFNEILERMTYLYLDEGITEEEFLEWLDSNLDSTCESLYRRQQPDLERMRQSWQVLEPVRETMTGLPEKEKAES
jgi:ABC-type glycerol-3-phosphate transport system substrate-binding protein